MTASIDESARELIETIQRLWNVPGSAVVVSDAEGVIFEHYSGFADLARRAPVSASHLFEIGSISKVATSMVVLQLAEEGLLRLEDRIAELLPWLDGLFARADITVERLLQHAAGIISGVDAVPDELGQVAGALMDARAARGSPAPVRPTEPGAEDRFFHYSNLGFILLGLAAARVSGETLEDLVADRVLKRAGMTESISAVRHSDMPRLARGYQARIDDQPWTPGDPLIEAPWIEVAGADGNIAATGRDLAAFARVLVRRGAGAPGLPRLLSPDSFTTMIARLSPGGEDTLELAGMTPSESSRYGLGINVERVAGRLVLSHGGGMVGYASFVLADPDRDLGVAVLTNANGDSPIAEAIARPLLALFGDERSNAGRITLTGRLDPREWTVGAAQDPAQGPAEGAPALRPRVIETGMLGRFVATDPHGTAQRLIISTTRLPDGGARLDVESGGMIAPLSWSWSDGAVTTHPSLRRFPLFFLGDRWAWGEKVFLLEDGAAAPAAGAARPDLLPYCGHYRSYSPWFTNFRVVSRGEDLILIASPGVEAPTGEVALVELEPGFFRLGADPRLPERLAFGPIIDGRSAWADRDGCRYSRAFTD